MANRRITVVEISEVLRLMRAGQSDRAVAKLLGHNRATIGRYRQWAMAQGLLEGALAEEGELQRRLAETLPAALPPQQVSSLMAYLEEIRDYRGRGLEMAAIRARLEEAHRHPVSYNAVRRLVRKLEPREAEAFVRVEVPPGSEAQVDFGYAGEFIDPASGELRKGWVFVLVLSFSRHLYAEVVLDQKVGTWILCHAHAFEWFGGVPGRVVLDNLKAGVARVSLHEPEGQRSYRECAEHYGFLIDPNPPRSPHLKGKVEQGGVHYVARNFLAGRGGERLDEVNRGLRDWAAGIAGQRVHGTTKQRPLERFERVERAALAPLPRAAYDPATWKRAKVYRDCYLTFERSYYSAPFRLIGETLWVRGGARAVALYDGGHQLVATHDRAREPGERKFHPDHFPKEKLPGLMVTREGCRERAAAIGPATAAAVAELLAHRPEDRLRNADRLLRLTASYPTERVEAACARALAYGEAGYPSVRRILAKGLDREPPPALTPAGTPAGAGGFKFARGVGEFVAALLGVAP
jgi:transposase